LDLESILAKRKGFADNLLFIACFLIQRLFSVFAKMDHSGR